MKSCMNCNRLLFDKKIGSSRVLECGAGKWEWDRLDVDTPLVFLKFGCTCDCWEFRIESLYIVRNEP